MGKLGDVDDAVAAVIFVVSSASFESSLKITESSFNLWLFNDGACDVSLFCSLLPVDDDDTASSLSSTSIEITSHLASIFFKYACASCTSFSDNDSCVFANSICLDAPTC